jgi:hypothetical protein
MTKPELNDCYILIKKYNSLYIGELIYDCFGKTVLKKVVHKKLFEVQHQLKLELIKRKLHAN